MPSLQMAVRAMGRILWLTMEDKVENADIPSIQDIKSLVDKSKDKPKTTEEQGYNVLSMYFSNKIKTNLI